MSLDPSFLCGQFFLVINSILCRGWCRVLSRLAIYFLWNCLVRNWNLRLDAPWGFQPLTIISEKLIHKTADNPAGVYLLKVNNKNTKTRCEICSKLTIKALRHWRHSGVFVVNFEHISHLALVFLLLTLNKQLPTGGILRGWLYGKFYLA